MCHALPRAACFSSSALRQGAQLAATDQQIGAGGGYKRSSKYSVVAAAAAAG